MLEAVDFSFACLDRKRNMMKNNLRVLKYLNFLCEVKHLLLDRCLQPDCVVMC